jgi:diadenosine tetraphosphatase ApaH/serine/threonine PP2A family protein phosphatase
VLVHASPRDEDEYQDDLSISEGPLEPGSALTFFGHTHVQGGYAISQGAVRRVGRQFQPLDGVTVKLDPEWQYLINPGSVGQPRDDDPRAAFAFYDPDEATVRFHRVEYDVAGAQAKIRAARLPDFLAARLAVGR